MSYKKQDSLSRWTEYCSELYNCVSYGDNTVLDCNRQPEKDLQPILCEEDEIAIAALKKEKSAGADNIPAELIQAGGEIMTHALIKICKKIWKTDEWPTPRIQLLITFPKRALPELQNQRPHQSSK